MQDDMNTLYSQRFPPTWEMPPPHSLPPQYRYMSIEKVIERNMIKPFLGTVDDYPRFKASFYNMVHIQPGPVFFKILALDKLITDEFTTKLLSGLTTTAADYAQRIARLEKYFGGPSRLQSQQLKTLRELKGVMDQSLEVFRNYTHALQTYLNNSPSHEATNPVLLADLKDHMSPQLKLQYNQYLMAERAYDNNWTLAQFLETRLLCEEQAREGEKSRRNAAKVNMHQNTTEHMYMHDGHHYLGDMDPQDANNEMEHVVMAHAEKRDASPCACCNKPGHKIIYCEQFFVMNSLERRQFAADRGLCYLCLATTHRSNDCPYQNTKCNICGFKHHFLLHPPSNANSGRTSNVTNIADTQFNYTFQQAKEPRKAIELDVALTYFTAILRNPTTKKTVQVNLLADSGANNNCLDIELAQELGIEGTKQPFHVQVGGGNINSYWSLTANLEIIGLQEGAETYPITFQAYEQPCGQLSSVDWSTKKAGWSHLADINFPKAAPRPVQGIVGTCDFYLLAPTTAAVTQGPQDPIAFNTRLGWMVGGKIRPANTITHIHVNLMHHNSCCHDTKKALERLWNAEHPDTAARLRNQTPDTPRTPSEQRAESLFDESRKRLPDGRYQVGLLWKDNSHLPSNYRQALQAFYNLERQMQRHPDMQTQFVNTIKDWMNKKIATYASSTDPIQYVIPTFFVVRLDKVTTSYRLVVDGARKFNGTCINDKLLAGPKLIQNVFDVLVRFRQGSHAFTCDIHAMYLNVKVAPEDHKFLNIFFREHPSHPLKVVQLTSHPFGLSSSPYVAMRVVQKHAHERREQYPLTQTTVQKCAIVDDFIVSGDSADALQKTREQLQQLLAEIQMPLHKMASNHPGILTGIEPEKIAKAKTMGEDDTVDPDSTMPTIKTLGITWNSHADILAVNYQPRHADGVFTLRKVVSEGGRYYDPLGLTLPVIMTCRILQQYCWAESKHWDEPLPLHLQDRWKKWSKAATEVANIHIPRAIKHRTKPLNKQRLIIFTDASAEAQAAVAYVQNLYCDGQLEARMLAARGKVTSLRKRESIPRLECLAAAMGAELAAKLSQIYDWPIESALFFSDSTTTLWWLRTTKPLKIFVANRICTILDISNVSQWRYVNTKENPADLPTRTASVHQLAKHHLWWWGPKFLTQPEKQWSKQPPVTESNEALTETYTVEKTLNKLHLAETNPKDICKQAFFRNVWSQFSNSRKGLGIASIVFQATGRFLKRVNRAAWEPVKKPLQQPRETLNQQLLTFCIAGEQQHHLAEVIQALQRGNEMPKRFACWRLFQDPQKVLRINGRLARCKTLSEATKNPIFLTANMPLATEIIKMKHEDLQHAGGPQFLITNVREAYWIEHGLKLAKQVIGSCAHCQARNCRKIAHETAPLHFTRENAPQGRVFYSIGIDMFGPMEVTQGRGKPKGKRYGLIFTCSFSRAINVEVMKDASADSCLLAFKRHAAIYGQPVYVNSDQGKNIQYARKVLHEIDTVWEDAQPLLQTHFPTTNWQTNPPYTPSYGGHYESLIKVIKNAFKHMAKWPRYSFNDEQLLTGLKEAVAMANMRPLTEYSPDPNDPPPLRPSDFLHTPILGVTPDWRHQTSHTRIKEEIEQFKQELWFRMRTEVLSNLQKLKHWEKGPELHPGDLVLYKDDEWRPDFWPLAKVLEVFPGKDNETRVVRIRYVSFENGKFRDIKEATHSTKNLFRIQLPEATRKNRLAWHETQHDMVVP